MKDATMNLVILDGYTTNPGDCSWDSIAKFGSLDVDERSAVSEIQQRAVNADVVLTNKTPLSAEIIANLPKLKLICVLATGVNVVDLEAAQARGITVIPKARPTAATA